MYALKIRKIGNSVGAIIPKEMLEKLRVKEGDDIFATELPEAGGLRITSYQPDFEASMKAFERTRRKYRNALRELAK